MRNTALLTSYQAILSTQATGAGAHLSHVGTFPLLFAALVLLAIACWWRGERSERVPARWIVGTAVVAAIFSAVTYYGHFAAVYKSLDRVTGRAASIAAPALPAATGDPTPAADGGSTPPTTTRAATAVDVALRAVGWPIGVLWLLGTWRLIVRAARDRLTSTLLAWFGTCAVFVAFGVLGPVEPSFYRYTVEFIGRVIYATWPAAVMVAAAGSAWAWRAGPIGRLASAILLGSAVWVGALSWWSWIR